jgi:hypothetical protein
MNYLVDTAEIPMWTSDDDAPRSSYAWGVYTELGPFKPAWRNGSSVPYARRVEHAARHEVKARWGSLRRWAVNVWREAGEFAVGAFQPIRDAI